MASLIEIRLRNGKTISGRSDFARGSPQFPMSFDDVAEKFRDAAGYAKWDKTKTIQIVDSVRHLEDLPNLRKLAALCQA